MALLSAKEFASGWLGSYFYVKAHSNHFSPLILDGVEMSSMHDAVCELSTRLTGLYEAHEVRVRVRVWNMDIETLSCSWRDFSLGAY